MFLSAALMWWKQSSLSSLWDFLSQVPRPWNISTSRCLPHCKQKTQVTHDSSLPFTQHTRCCASPALGFIESFQNPFFFVLHGTHLSISPWTAISSIPSLLWHHQPSFFFFKSLKKHHSTLLRPCFSPTAESLPSIRHLFIFSSQTIVFTDTCETTP